MTYIPKKYYQIWVGYYHLGQGYNPPTQPELIAVIYSINFKLACYECETLGKLEMIHSIKSRGEDIHTYSEYYNPDTMRNNWTGQYYETKGEALKSFK